LSFSPGFLNFSATDSQLESLLSACQPEIKDVQDESYLKVGKMDVGNFAMPFSPCDEGLVCILAEILLRGRFGAKDIKVELSKLNVYGKTMATLNSESDDIIHWTDMPRTWRIFQGSCWQSS